MSDTKYFVRSRGRITGPFEFETLEKLVRRGTVGKLDELSVDRQEWKRAGQNEALFPRPTVPVRAAPSAELPLAEPVIPEAIGVREEVPSIDREFFYRQNGTTIGPVKLPVLQSLARAGAISEEDLVWQENSEVMVAAGRLTHLAEFFDVRETRASHSGHRRGTGSTKLSNTEVAALSKSYATKTKKWVTVGGVLFGILAILALHLPWYIGRGEISGWWTPLLASHDSPESQQGIVLLIFGVALVTLSALTVLLVASVARGMGRAITSLCVGGAGLLFYLWAAVSSPSTSAVLLVLASIYVIPIASNGLSSFLRAKSITGGQRGNVAIAVMSAVSALASLIVIISIVPILAEAAKFMALFVGITAFLIANLLALTASVLGFVNLKPVFSPALSLAAIVCARTGAVLIAVSLIVMILDISALGSFLAKIGAGDSFTNDAAALRMVMILSLLRMLILVMFYPAVAALGFEELAIATIAVDDAAEHRFLD